MPAYPQQHMPPSSHSLPLLLLLISLFSTCGMHCGILCAFFLVFFPSSSVCLYGISGFVLLPFGWPAFCDLTFVWVSAFVSPCVHSALLDWDEHFGALQGFCYCCLFLHGILCFCFVCDSIAVDPYTLSSPTLHYSLCGILYRHSLPVLFALSVAPSGLFPLLWEEHFSCLWLYLACCWTFALLPSTNSYYIHCCDGCGAPTLLCLAFFCCVTFNICNHGHFPCR